jgi:hypothetical protein
VELNDSEWKLNELNKKYSLLKQKYINQKVIENDLVSERNSLKTTYSDLAKTHNSEIAKLTSDHNIEQSKLREDLQKTLYNENIYKTSYSKEVLSHK